MVSMFKWINYIRPDVSWIKGPLEDNSYQWDTELPNQQEIIDRIASYNLESTLPEEIPKIVTPRQIRLALVFSGISLSVIETAINSMEEPNKSAALITWEYATEFDRNHPMILSLSPSLGLTEQDLDNLFILANTL